MSTDIDDNFSTGWDARQKEINKLERTLATTTQERDDWKEASERNGDGYVYYKEKCATKDLEVTKLREALRYHQDQTRPIQNTIDILSTPITTEALDSYVAEKVKEARS